MYLLPIGRGVSNIILDTSEYIFKLGYGEFIELTYNVISKSMHSSCNNYGNSYIFLNSLVDKKNDEHIISLKYKKIVVRGRPYLILSIVDWHIFVQCKDGSTLWKK